MSICEYGNETSGSMISWRPELLPTFQRTVDTVTCFRALLTERSNDTCRQFAYRRIVSTVELDQL